MKPLSSCWSTCLMDYDLQGDALQMARMIKWYVHRPENRDCLYRLRNDQLWTLFDLTENAK